MSATLSRRSLATSVMLGLAAPVAVLLVLIQPHHGSHV